MKAKILLTALFAFLLVNGNAFMRNSSLNIDILEHPLKSYVIELDNGTTYQTDRDIKINNLRFGQTGLRIFKRTYRGHGRQSQRFEEKLVYSGVIEIPRNTTVFSHLRNRQLFITRVVPKRNKNVRLGMHPETFDHLKYSILHESFDKDKVELMIIATRNNPISTRQVLELMDFLSFDSYKLRFAKKAYSNTVDKQNYFVVRNGLTFSSNRRKLSEFLNGKTYNKPQIPRRNQRENRGHRRR